MNQNKKKESTDIGDLLPLSPEGIAKIAIVLGSKSDIKTAKPAFEVFIKAKVPFEVRILSAHRNPGSLQDFVKQAKHDIFIAVAGLSAALPGAIASLTEKPVLGVPVSAGTLGGMDALLSIAQMPPGVPVATFGIDNAKNAALFALKILDLIKRSR